VFKALGWIITALFAIFLFFFVTTRYNPLQRELREVRKELSMWEEVVKRGGEHVKSWRFSSGEIFDRDHLSPKGEVMLARFLDSIAAYGSGHKLHLAGSGARKDLPLWFDRLHRTLRFIAANSSLNVTGVILTFTSSKEERFDIHIDD